MNSVELSVCVCVFNDASLDGGLDGMVVRRMEWLVRGWLGGVYVGGRFGWSGGGGGIERMWQSNCFFFVCVRGG